MNVKKKVTKYELSVLRRFAMAQEKSEGGGGRKALPPPPRIGLSIDHFISLPNESVVGVNPNSDN